MRLQPSIRDHCPLNLDFAVSVVYVTDFAFNINDRQCTEYRSG